jgi:hypothetical protein
VIVTLPLCDLVEDLEIYPRHAIDDKLVTDLLRALDSGVTLPPVLVDKRSKRIVDGWHRARAHRRKLGPAGVIDVDLQAYASDADLVLAAVTINSAHGKRLEEIDKTRAVLMLQRYRIERVAIAAALHVPEERVTKLSVRVARAEHAGLGTVPGTKKICLKRPVAHLEGQTLSDEQVAVHGMLPGTSFLLIARQLKEALRVQMVNLEDERLAALLRQLRDQLLLVFPLEE